MKISNFRDLKRVRGMTALEGKLLTATVDVETGMLWWRKKAARPIFKNWVHWHFYGTGEGVPGGLQLELAYRANVESDGK